MEAAADGRDPAGQEADEARLGTGAKVAAALKSGSIDLGAGVLTDCFNLARVDDKTRLVADLVDRYYVDVVVGTSFDGPPVSAPLDQRIRALRGKKIGITGPGSGTEALVTYLFHRVGMNPQTDAELVNLGSTSTAALGALKSHRVDALSFFQPIAQQAAAGTTIDAETLLDSIEASTLMEKYFSPEQMQSITQRGDALGPQRIREVEQAWPDVIAGMRAGLDLGKDPSAPEVQALARRWRSLVREFTGGDAGIQRSLNAMFKDSPATMQAQTGIDPALMAYACRAIGLLDD